MSLQILQVNESGDDVAGTGASLAVSLSTLVGELFGFLRVTYGDEATFHFGEMRPSSHPKRNGTLYGDFILGVRGSPWLLKSGTEPVVVCSGPLFTIQNRAIGKSLDKRELEKLPLVKPQSRVVSVTPFEITPIRAFGLDLRLSDGSALIVLPTLPVPDTPEEIALELPQLADWELLTPRGLVSAWPDLKWTFEVETATKLPEPVPADQTTPIPDPASTPAVTST